MTHKKIEAVEENKEIITIIDTISNAPANIISIGIEENKLMVFIGNQPDVIGGLNFLSKKLLIKSNKEMDAVKIVSEDKRFNNQFFYKDCSFDEKKKTLIKKIEATYGVSQNKPTI